MKEEKNKQQDTALEGVSGGCGTSHVQKCNKCGAMVRGEYQPGLYCWRFQCSCGNKWTS